MKTLSTIISVVALLLLIGGIGGVVYFFNLFGIRQAVYGETIYMADWGHICCEEGAFEPAYIRYTDDESTYECNGYTDECHIRIINTYSGFLNRGDGKYEICKISGGDCSTQTYSLADGQTGNWFTISYGYKITFKEWSWATDNRPYHKYEAKFRKFYIQGEENDKVYVHKSCILNSALKQ